MFLALSVKERVDDSVRALFNSASLSDSLKLADPLRIARALARASNSWS